MRHFLPLFATLACAAEPGIDLSDGSRVSGPVRLPPGAELRFHDGSALRVLDPALVREIRLVPSNEQMLRAFAMPEPGKALRVETGDPYPLRELAAEVSFTNGDERHGHLYATKILVAGDEEDQGVFIPAKQQGKPGTRLDELVYPRRIVFSAAPPDHAAGPTRLRLATGTADELGLASVDSLAPLTATVEEGSWTIDPLLGSQAYVAVRRGDAIAVGWSGEDPAAHAQIAAGVPEIRDYYEDKRLIAVRRIDDSTRVDSLMLLVRTGEGTDGPHKPWHVEVWRWRLDPDDAGRLLLSARVCLARGRDGLPTVTADSTLWPQKIAGNELIVGDEK